MTQLSKCPPAHMINWHVFWVYFEGGGKVCLIKVCHSVLVLHVVKFDNRRKIKRGNRDRRDRISS